MKHGWKNYRMVLFWFGFTYLLICLVITAGMREASKQGKGGKYPTSFKTGVIALMKFRIKQHNVILLPVKLIK